MSEESRKRAYVNYERMSRWYDLFSGSERKAAEQGLAVLAVRTGERVLEIGPGSGRSLASLSKMTDHVTGIDISGGMLKEARKRSGNAMLVKADAIRLPFADRSFDAVFMSFTLELFDDADMESVLYECMRTLKPDGNICVVSMAVEDKQGSMGRIYAISHNAFPGIVDCRPIALRKVVSCAGFRTKDEKRISLMGLPVSIVLATKPS